MAKSDTSGETPAKGAKGGGAGGSKLTSFRLKVIKSKTSIDFLGYRRIWAMVSSAAAVLSLVGLLLFGLNFGIDFRGGTLVEARMPGQAADLGAIRDVVGDLGLGEVAIQEFGDPRDVLVRVEEQTARGAAEAPPDASLGVGQPASAEVLTAATQVSQALQEAFPGAEIRRTETVGPKVSGELIQSGVIAVVLAVASVLFYIWVRFEWQFSLGAVAALVHDVLLTVGLFSLLQLQFTLAIIAALLTIVGYSLNDTVVVFDRVRENLRRYKTTPLEDVLNLSINETLSRTLMTSITTLLALLALYFLGGEVIRGFTFAMIWGVVIGTYSSIFIASPILAALGVERDPDKDEGPSGVQYS
ncbi:MAG: protein translocase subunit SecF [Pseudomonadota bacterium]